MLILNFSPLRFYGLFPLRFALSVYLPNALSIVSLSLSHSLSVLWLCDSCYYEQAHPHQQQQQQQHSWLAVYGAGHCCRFVICVKYLWVHVVFVCAAPPEPRCKGCSVRGVLLVQLFHSSIEPTELL